MDRHWLLTWTTYGTWLPGDRRGFVGPIRQKDGSHVIHNMPGTNYDKDMPALEHKVKNSMKGERILLSLEQAVAISGQFQKTATYRNWGLCAVAVMANHVHLVVVVKDDPDPERLLHSFKSYASRALNNRWRKPINGTWWTVSGSKRKLPDKQAVVAAIQYVLNQGNPLVIWEKPGA